MAKPGLIQVQQQPSFALQLGGNPDYPDLLFGVFSVILSNPSSVDYLPDSAVLDVQVSGHYTPGSGSGNTALPIQAWYELEHPDQLKVNVTVYSEPPANDYSDVYVNWWITLVDTSLIAPIDAQSEAPPLIFGQGSPINWTVGQSNSYTITAVSAFLDVSYGTTPTYNTPVMSAYLLVNPEQAAPALPSWMTFTDNGNSTGTLTGTPPVGSEGNYLIQFVANPASSTSLVGGAQSDYTITVVSS